MAHQVGWRCGFERDLLLEMNYHIIQVGEMALLLINKLMKCFQVLANLALLQLLKVGQTLNYKLIKNIILLNSNI